MAALLTAFAACTQVDLFEKNVNIKGGEWSAGQQPEIELNIRDTMRFYKVFLVVRHTNSYSYRNLWVKVGLQQPGDTVARNSIFEVPLAGPDSWNGTGINDVYEWRGLLFPQPVRFRQPGLMKFTIYQIMRQNPLRGILQVGIRLEPAN